MKHSLRRTRPAEELPNPHHKAAVDVNQLVVPASNFNAIASLLKQLGRFKALSAGRRVHACISACGYDWSTFLGNALIYMYGCCGCLDDARSIFDRIPRTTLQSWNALINIYGLHGRVQEAQSAFDQIPSPDVYSWNILIKVYAESGNVEEAERVFIQMPYRDVVSWNTMISAFSQNGRCRDALYAFVDMRTEGFQPDRVTFVCVLDACASLAALKLGEEIHALTQKTGLEQDVMIGTALVDMYGKCNDPKNAKIVFQKMVHRNTVTWTAMISSFLCNELNHEALITFYQMQIDGVKPNPCTYVCALDACADLVAVEEGQDIYSTVVNDAHDANIYMSTALLSMYAKAGNLNEVLYLFDKMHDRDIHAWTTIISAFARNSHGNEALGIYKQMIAENVKPNDITFISVLNACSCLGVVEEGRCLFGSMKSSHSMEPDERHVACMIDLLGRAGHLDEAEQLLTGMSCEHAVSTWATLLSACRIHGDVERAVHAANACFILDPEYVSPYIGLYNIHSGTIT